MKHILSITTSIYLVGAMNVFAASEFSEKEKIKAEVQSASIAAFAKENLIVGNINEGQAKSWYEQLKRVLAYVKKNQSSLVKMDYAVDKIETASYEMISSVNIVYDSFIKQSFKKPADQEKGLKFLSDELTDFSDQVNVNQLNLTAAAAQIKKLNSTVQDLVSLSTEISKKKVILPTSFDVQEVLLYTINVLYTTVKKVLSDFEKLQQAASI